MLESTIEFGYYPKAIDVNVGDISIASLNELEEIVNNIDQDDWVFNDWFYAPFERNGVRDGAEKITLPYSARVFSLPKTHELKHRNSGGEKHLEFLVWALSFFLGMRLTSTKAGFLDNTPIKSGKLVDFILINNSLESAIEGSEEFWDKNKHNPKMISRINGIVHALFMAQNPRSLHFEKFLMAYTALDACYACVKDLRNGKSRLHAQRIEWMCDELGMITPDWAKEQSKSKTELSIVRNDSIHESLFFNQPLGFSVYGGNEHERKNVRNIPLEMRNLICRVLVYLLVGNNDYTASRVDTRQKFGLKLIPK